MDSLPAAPKVPILDIDRLPVEEQKNALHLQALLHLLDAFVVRFENALSLSEHCKELLKQHAKEAAASGLTEELFRRIAEKQSWRLVAAREAAMAVYHYSCTFESISFGVHRCPAIKTRMKHRPFTMARKLFSKHFPNAEMMRHAISHTAEMAATVESLKENASKYRRHFGTVIPEDAVAMAIGPSFSNNRLVLSYKGNDVSIEITPAARERLCQISGQIYVMFRQLVRTENRNRP
jgi:hypothetical protein